MPSDALTSSVQPLFFFDRDRLASFASANAVRYQHAEPFPHIVIDDFLPEATLDRLLTAFPEPDDLEWRRFDSDQEVKLASEDPSTMPDVIRQVLAEFNSATMIDFLERLTGIEGLIPDPHYWGGGLHQIESGGHLDIHSDFNWHNRLLLDRRLNLLLYLNPDWQPQWGGALELWDRDMRECRQRIVPLANRCVIFSTTDDSLHGHPEPVACPTGRTRRSLALYYYSNGRPAAEISSSRTTAFKPRPGEAWRRPPSAGPSLASRLTPPILADAARRTRDRIRGAAPSDG
jgi:hypothetical protein